MKLYLLFFLLLTNLLRADNITITADEWCPYNCSENAHNKGFLVDIFTYIFEKRGYEVIYTVADSYEKAIKDVRENRINAIIGSTREETPDFIFPKYPLAYSYDIIITEKDSLWNYTSPQSLNQICLGVIKDYAYDDVITQHIIKNKNDQKKIQMISGNNALEYNLKKLRYQKITALIDDQLLIRYYFTQKKTSFPFKIATSLKTYPLYISFSPKDYKAQTYANILSYELKKLKGTDVLHKILAKYGLTEKDILQPNKDLF